MTVNLKIFKFVYLIAIDLDTQEGLIICKEEEDEDDDKKLLHWTNLKCDNFEVIHGFYRVLKLIPDKLLTALEINSEYLDGDNSGSFLIALAIKLLKYYAENNKATPAVSFTLNTLISDLASFSEALDWWQISEAKIIADYISEKLDGYFVATKIYLEFLHSQLNSIKYSKYVEKNSFDLEVFYPLKLEYYDGFHSRR
jgi:hypothetical protein